MSKMKSCAIFRFMSVPAPNRNYSTESVLIAVFSRVGSVAQVYHHLRPEDEKRAAIFCQNYGEAGAIDFFGPKLGLPPAISGHQNYFLWGQRDWTGEVILVSTRMMKTSASYSAP
jgi:hypothetical protein